MTTEITQHQPAAVAVGQPSATTMRLVEWAEEAQAAHGLAKALCETPFAGQFKGQPGAATAAILRGFELGLTPVTSLAAFDVIQGTPAPKAMTLRALAQSHGHDIEIVDSTNEKAVARYRRAGRQDWLTCEFTIEDAKGLGLLSKDNWRKQPRTMLEARVTSKAARLVASDVLLGIGYSSEELRDGDVRPSAPTSQRVTAADVLGATDTNEEAPAEPDAEPTPEPQQTEPEGW